jgi:hypothetical protein
VSKGVSTTERGQRASAGDPRPEPAGNCLEGGEWVARRRCQAVAPRAVTVASDRLGAAIGARRLIEWDGPYRV